MRTTAQGSGPYVPSAATPRQAGGGGVNVVTDSLTAAQRRVEEAWDSIEHRVQKLMDTFEALQSHWQGQASTDYQNAVHDWNDAKVKCQKRLADMMIKLGKSGQTYHQSDVDSGADIRRVSGNLHR